MRVFSINREIKLRNIEIFTTLEDLSKRLRLMGNVSKLLIVNLSKRSEYCTLETHQW